MKLSQIHPTLRPLSHFLGRLSLAAVQILILGTFAWLGLRWYPGDRWLPIRLGNYFAPWLLLALFPALAMILLARRRRWAGLA